MTMDQLAHLAAVWIQHFYEIISTQLVIVLLLILLCIVYLIPKILETWLSNLLSRRLPCDLTVHRFGFIFAEGIAIRFINGEIVYIRTVSFKSSLLNSNVSSLIVVFVDYVEFQTTHGGLYEIVRAIRRKNEGFYPRKSRSERDTWPGVLIGSISKFLSIVISDIHVGLWPSVQLAKVNSSWLNWNSGLRSEVNRGQRVAAAKPSAHAPQSDPFEDKLNMDYLDWATNSKLAAMFMLTSLRITFYCSRDCIRIRLNGSRLCSKLLSTSEDAGCKMEYRDDDDDEENFDDAEDDGVDAVNTRGGGMLLGHARIYPLVDLVFYRHFKTTPESNARRVRDEEFRWRPKSICLKLYGIRAGLMEELLELLKQRLHFLKHGSPSLPTSPVTFASLARSTSFRPSVSGDGHLKAGINQSASLRSSSVSPLGRTTFHMCLSVLPLRLMTGRSGRSCLTSQHIDQEMEDIGFRFELIRFVFRRSLQLKFHSLLFTGDHISPCHGWSSVSLPAHSYSSLCPTSSTMKNLGSPDSEQHTDGDTTFVLPFSDSSGDLQLESDTATGHASLECSIHAQFKLNKLHLINGWDEQRQHCTLDYQLSSVVLDTHRQTTGCFFNLTIGRSQLLYIHSSVELCFFTELVNIFVATCYWLAEQRCQTRNRLSTFSLDRPRRISFPPNWNIGHSHTPVDIHRVQCPSHGWSVLEPERRAIIHPSQPSFSVHQAVQVGSETDYSSFWIRLANTLGLNRRHLTVHVRFGNCTLASVPGRQQVTMWPGLHPFTDDGCWSRFEETTVNTFSDSLPSNLEQQRPEMRILLATDSCSIGMQLGMNNFMFNYDCHSFEASLLPLLQSDATLSVSAFHLTTLNMNKLCGAGWLVESPDCPKPGISSVLFEPSPSTLLDRRSDAHALNRLTADSVPQPDQHRWGQMFSLCSCLFQYHNHRLIYSVHGVQMEWPNPELLQLVNYWSTIMQSPVACTCGLSECSVLIPFFNLIAGHRISQRAHFPTPKPNATSPSLSHPPLVVEGKVNECNAFVVCVNGVILTLRVDMLRSSSVIQCSNPISVPSSADSQLSSPLRHDHFTFTDDTQPIDVQLVLQESKINLGAIKMTYHSRKPGSRNSGFTNLIPESKTDSDSSYRINSGDQLQHQLFWLPELVMEISMADKLVLIKCPQPVEFLWTPALHLCLLESIRTWRQLSSGFSAEKTRWHRKTDPFQSEFLTRSTPMSLSSQNKPTQQQQSKHLVSWVVRFTATTNVQIFMHLASDAHQVAFCFKSPAIRLHLNSFLRPKGSDEVTDKSATRGIPASQIKLSCYSVVMRCDSENIAVVKQFTVRRRPHAFHHRVDYNKLGLMLKSNTAWEFDADVIYFTFPYRYRFNEVYQELTTIIKFIRALSASSTHPSTDNSTAPVQPTSSQRSSKQSELLTVLPEEDPDDQGDTVPLGRGQLSIQSCTQCSTSPHGDGQLDALQNCVPADWIIHLKRFVLEIKDDPFECKLNDNHLVLQDERLKREERLSILEEKLQSSVQSGIRVSESDRLNWFALLEAQCASEYRSRLIRFKQEFPTADELFTWTLDTVHLKVLADSAFAHPESVIDRMRQMDSCSPWPQLTPSHFTTLWCRQVSLNVDRWRFQLRDYPKPWLEMTDLLLWGPLAGAERLADWIGQRTVRINPGAPWPDYSIVRNCLPLKFFYDWNADVKEILMCYGANWEPTLAWFSQRLEDINPKPWDLSVPRLGWWDRVRHLLHGRLYVVSDAMHWLCSTSLNPYNATEFFAWQWSRSTVCWETAKFHLEGDLDILYYTASKYDGVCPLLHLPRLDMNIKLDWLSLQDPFDHHSVRPCNTQRLHRLGIKEHDSYRNFRSNRLSMRISCAVRPATDGNTDQPWCLFYTSVLKFADKLRMCLTKVARPIRRGRIFGYTPSRKPIFGRILQSLEFSLNLPQLELSYWVSYAKRTGVHVTTGPVQLVADLRCSIELENKSTCVSRRISVLPPHVTLPSASGVIEPSSEMQLRRRPQVSWTVVHLLSSLRDSRIQLRHRPDLPGQVVQMLQSAGLLKEDTKPGDSTSRNTQTDRSEEFIIVPLLHYEQVAPAPPITDSSIRVHIPGRRLPNSSNHTSTSPVDSAPRTSTVPKASNSAGVSTTEDTTSSGPEHDVSESVNSNDTSQLTHESLTPTHQLKVSDMKLRWTEHTRDLVYMLMDTYQHAQSLKRNLSARATHAFQLQANPSQRTKSDDTLRPEMLVMHNRVASTGSNLTSQSIETALTDVAPVPSHNSYHRDMGIGQASFVASESPDLPTARDTVQSTASQVEANDIRCSIGSPQRSEIQTQSDRSWLPGLGRVPMLAQLLDEVDTARFYAYCEEEPKQTDVMGQLQGLNICASSPVAARNWHVELVNSQLLLNTRSLAGYVLVTAARANLNALAHPPIWRDAQLLNKSSLVGYLEGMQYFATVGQVIHGASDQWLSTADVSDWMDEDALSGRPEVVGCGRSVGGVVTACVSSHLGPVGSGRGGGTHQTSPVGLDRKSAQARLHSGLVTSAQPIQLQRMISRCSCQVFYVHYEPVDPAKFSPHHLIPPLPLDENDVVRTSEGADTVTILHHTLNIFTNSPQYHMIVDIVNDLILYVEPQRKAQSERNRVALGLMSESQVRTAILREQECLRQFVAKHRHLERELWALARQVMSSLDVTQNPSTFFAPGEHPPEASELASLGRVRQPVSVPGHPLSMSIRYVQYLESQVTQIKTRIVEQNTILSQRLAYYQQLQVKAQRRHMQVAMTNKAHTTGAGSSFALFPAYASSASLLRHQQQHRKADDHTSLSPPLVSTGSATEPQNRLSTVDGYAESEALSRSELDLTETVTGERLQPQQTAGPPAVSIPATGTINTSSSTGGLMRQRSLSKVDAPPAPIVRRSEVCFEHAKWRMTESDGQIGLADVELRGFLYAKTHRQDDSGSHWLELGWIRVSNLVPDCFQKEVLAPDITCGHYAGGPILRIACSELTPVGGISVKGAMEISVAPMSLQISKQFYRVMMPFFFPDKSEEQTSNALVSHAPVPVSCETASGLPSAIGSSNHVSPIHQQDPDSTSLPNTSVADHVDGSSKSYSRARRRFHPSVNFIRHLHRLQPSASGQPVPEADFAVDSQPSPAISSFPNVIDGGSTESPSCNLTVEAAMSGKTNCSASTDVVGFLNPVPSLTELNRLSFLRSQPDDVVSLQAALVPSPPNTLSITHFRRPVQPPTGEPNLSELWFLGAPQPSSSNTGLLGTSSNMPTTTDLANPVEVMRERARRNNVFLYIKIPGFPICLSYKGEKQKNLTDVTGFQLNIPTLEYHNCVWTWLDFAMEVKTRIQRQLIREVIKKKFTPRRRLPLIHFGRFHSDRNAPAQDGTSGADPTTVHSDTAVTTTSSSNLAPPEECALPTALAQEQRVQREVEMLLGRHAQLQPPPSGKWRRLKPHRL